MRDEFFYSVSDDYCIRILFCFVYCIHDTLIYASDGAIFFVIVSIHLRYYELNEIERNKNDLRLTSKYKFHSQIVRWSHDRVDEAVR